jgi:hypothetical protein
LAQEIANILPEFARKFEQPEGNENRETHIIKIYAQALNTISNSKWKDICDDILQSNNAIRTGKFNFM